MRLNRLFLPMRQTVLRLGALVVGGGLIALGLGAIAFPEVSAGNYGIPTDTPAWVAAAGARDLSLGLVILGLHYRHPDALRGVWPAVLCVPVADVVLVLWNHSPLVSALPHAAGAIAIAFLAGLAWLSPTRRDDANADPADHPT